MNELFFSEESNLDYKEIESFVLSNEKVLKTLRNKKIYLPFANPYTSILFKFFSLNFKKLGLLELFSTFNNDNYRYSIVKQPPVLFVNRRNFDVDYMTKYGFLKKEFLCDNFSFDSELSNDLLYYSDVIIAKPYTSFNKDFNIIANSLKQCFMIIPFECTTEFNVFRNIKHDRFKVSNEFAIKLQDKDNNISTTNVCYITNINLIERPNIFKKIIVKFSVVRLKPKSLKQLKHKSPSFELREPKSKQSSNSTNDIKNEAIITKFGLKKIDNYDAYIVSDIKNIPRGVDKIMAVSPDFIKHYNPHELEIVGITKEKLNKDPRLAFNNEFNTTKPVINNEQLSDMVFIRKRTDFIPLDYDWYRDNIFRKFSNLELKKQLECFINQEYDLSKINDKGFRYNKIINQFLEEVIYSARKSKCKYSPCDSLENDELLHHILEYIKKKPKFFADSSSVINLKRFYSGACKFAPKVANFSPNAAAKIYETLCPKENANIYDYSCGFGARMLGAIGSKFNYHYFGTDPNERLCVQLNKMGEWFFNNCDKKSTFKVYCQGSEEFIPELEHKIDLAFSSPPYFDLEVYTDDDRQCENKYKDNYSLWVELYVKPTVQNIKRYLKEDGVFALNIKNGTYGGYEHLLDDWTKCAEEEGFEIVDELTMHHQSARIALSNWCKQTYGFELKAGTEPVRVFKLKK